MSLWLLVPPFIISAALAAVFAWATGVGFWMWLLMSWLLAAPFTLLWAAIRARLHGRRQSSEEKSVKYSA